MRQFLRWAVWGSCFLVPVAVGWLHAERYGLYDFGSRYSTLWLVFYGLLFLSAAFTLGVPGLIERPVQAVVASASAALLPLLVVSLFFLLVDPPIRSRLLAVGIPVALFGVFLVTSLLHMRFERRSAGNDRVLLVMEAAELGNLERELDRRPERQFTVKQTVAPHVIANDPGALRAVVDERDVNLVVLSEASQTLTSVVEQSADLHEEGMRIRTLAMFYDEWLGKCPITELARTSLWFDIRDLQRGQYNRVKRIMDLTIAVVLLPLLIGAIPIVLVANRFGNPGPLFFRQERVGHRNCTFVMWKLRTMTTDANMDGQGEWTSESDPRITPFGRFLRRTHLDELPQVLNVLLGSLSIVGPRPEQRHYVDQLAKTIPFYSIRHAVKPGVTGWAQVNYPYGASELDALEKLQFELYYIRHQSLALDVRVIVRTFSSILFGQGR